jgi:hypothetical protein
VVALRDPIKAFNAYTSLKMGLSPRSAEHLIQGGKKMEGKRWRQLARIFYPTSFCPLLVRGERGGCAPQLALHLAARWSSRHDPLNT